MQVWLAVLGGVVMVTVTAWLFIKAFPGNQTRTFGFSSFTLVSLTFISAALLKGENYLLCIIYSSLEIFVCRDIKCYK